MFLDEYDETPYNVLNFLTSYINYGGRVTDAIDLRVIDVILRDFYNKNILRDDYAFSTSGTYVSLEINPDSPQRGYLERIEALPVNAEPDIFGMHTNANIACALNETFDLFDTLVLLQPRTTGGGGQTREDVIYEDVLDLQLRLPPNFDIEGIGMQYPTRYDESMNTVLLQESTRYERLLRALQSSLEQLKKALKGLVVMSGELESMADAFYSQKVPEAWEAVAYPSLKPLKSWFQEFVDRVLFLQKWIENGIPSAYWISGFFFPQAFLTGTLQNYARKHILPIDSISFSFNIIRDRPTELAERPQDGCLVYGLFMEGARWSFSKWSITESRPKELYTDLPVVHFMPVKDRKVTTKGVYRMPIYKVLSRAGTLSTTGHSTNFVLWIEIPSDREKFINNLGLSDQDTWIKAGVACFCSLRY